MNRNHKGGMIQTKYLRINLSYDLSFRQADRREWF